MALVETDVQIVRKFQDGALIAYGTINKETAKAKLLNPDQTDFKLSDADETTQAARAGIVAAFNTWMAAQLP